MNYQRPITVTCQECQTEFDEEEVKFEGIEEDIMGRDVLYFECPKCGAHTKSLRRG